MKRMFAFFRHLQWKLTLSYSVVTAGTVILLTTFLVGSALFVDNLSSQRVFSSYYWSKTAFQDNIPFLIKDSAALQAWLERVQAQGFTEADFRSYTVRESLDHANTFMFYSHPVFVLDPELNLLAAVPDETPDAIGKPFDPRITGDFRTVAILEAALTGSKDYSSQSLMQPDGSYLVSFPLRKSDDDPIAAIVVYYVKPLAFVTPTHLDIYRVFFLFTTAIMVLVSLPVGALFGWLVSRGLRKRLANLSTAAKAWSQGDFSVVNRDHSGDEVGELTRNLNNMAGQLETLLHSRNELARVEERNRLARDLHDTVKQQTYAARMQLSAAKNLIGQNPQAAAEHIEAALQLNRETQEELKLIIEELRPAALDGKGLSEAVKEYVAHWQEHTGVGTNILVSGDHSLPLDVEEVLFRVLQESLSNVARHASANRVEISLTMTPETVIMDIADDGSGFDLETVSDGSFGIENMKQRLASINGALTVVSKPAEGTKVTASVQLPIAGAQ